MSAGRSLPAQPTPDKIFDRMKIARQGGDPFIIGEILHPTVGYKSVCFFVAWFLDVNTL